MSLSVNPIDKFKNLSTKKKVAIVGATAGIVALNVAAALHGKKVLEATYPKDTAQFVAKNAKELEQGIQFGLVQKLKAGYSDFYKIASEKATKVWTDLKGRFSKQAETVTETVDKTVEA